MQNFAAPARPIVAAMIDAAARSPDRCVAFQGAPGANSHVAVVEAFPDALPLPCFSFDDAIDAVKEGRADCAMIPIENSLHGRVADIHFLLPESGLVITGEHFLPIRYALMGLGPVAGVRDAMSHPQALGQCRHWLRENGIAPVSYPDTAGAAAMVVELGDPATAALAPARSIAQPRIERLLVRLHERGRALGQRQRELLRARRGRVLEHDHAAVRADTVVERGCELLCPDHL